MCNKMAYPTAYRSRSSSRGGPRNAASEFLSNESGFLRFPDGRGTWGNPTKFSPIGDPVPPRPPLQLPPPPIPLTPPDPATRRQQDIPWWERGTGRLGRVAGAAALAWGLYDYAKDFWPQGEFTYPRQGPLPAGWAVQCGPTGWPGPPYRPNIYYYYSIAAAPPLNCGLGGQAFNLALGMPTANSNYVHIIWGTNVILEPVKRYYIDTQAAYPGAPPLNSQVTPVRYFPPSVPSHAVPYLPPGVAVNVIPSPMPFPSIPRQQVAPTPFASTRSSTELGVSPSPKPNPSPGGLSYRPSHPEVRPPPREKERKTDPVIGRIFKVMSQVGTWHSFVDALHRSLPAKYSHRRRSFRQKLEDIYQHYDEIRWERAARELFKYWLMYKAAGWAYGRVQRHLVELYGPNDGIRLYRSMVNAGLL